MDDPKLLFLCWVRYVIARMLFKNQKTTDFHESCEDLKKNAHFLPEVTIFIALTVHCVHSSVPLFGSARY